MSEPDELPLELQTQLVDFGDQSSSNVEQSSTGLTDKGSIIFARLDSEVYATAVSPDGRRVIAGLGNGNLQLLDLISGEPIGQPFQGHQDAVRSVAFSPDGNAIVSGSLDNTLRLWKLDGTNIGQPFQGHQDAVTSVAFSPDGNAIVSGSWDNTLRLWNLDGTSIGQPFQGHQNSVTSVAFSPDGNAIVSGSWETSVSLWQLEAGNTPHRIWVIPPAIATPIHNLADRRAQVSVPQSIANDLAQGEDQLNVKDEIEALATVLMLRSLQPPMAVGILGTWGSGKSFGMHLIQQKVNEIRSQSLTPVQAWGDANFPNRTDITSPYVGHLYQISFNAWTYAKSDLWASLMQEIFYELNRQISLEHQLGCILGNAQAASTQESESLDLKPTPQTHRYIDKFIYHPLTSLRNSILKIGQTIYKRIKTSLQQILNLLLIQLLFHIVVFFLFIITVVIVLVLAGVLSLLDRLTGKKFEVTEKLSYFLDSFSFFNWIGVQLTNYYFSNRLKTSFNSWRNGIESVIEVLLFLCFVGFPKRLRDRRRYWQQINPSPNSQTELNLFKHQGSGDAESAIPSNPIALAQALREGGEFWQVLYYMNEEQRTAFLQANLQPAQFNGWEKLTSNAEISNSLWSALDTVKQKEQAQLKAQEKELQKKETELQRQLKGTETEVNQSLAQRKLAAFWIPIVNALARLRFSSEEVEGFATTGKTAKMLRQTFNSWQGLMALFAMTLTIVIALDPESRTALVEAAQNLLTQTRLERLIPAEVKTFVTSLKETAINRLKELPQGIQNFRTHIPKGVQVLTAIVATVTALLPILKALSTYINSVQKEQARIQSERDGLLKQKQTKTETLVQQVAQLKLQLQEQRQRAGFTANYTSLKEFVDERLKGNSYGQHLGLMQQVKQDLATLSNRLTDQTHNRETLKELFPRGPARVMLYIDDLDRCPPNRVVEVLEAVQLLLNTKLFVVVMGIDDRYIARALEQVYQGVLQRGGQPSGIDYLEKIIQIPYRMRPISPANIDSYLRSQLKLRTPEKEQRTEKETPRSKSPTPPQNSEPLEQAKTSSKVQNQSQQTSTPSAPQSVKENPSQTTIKPLTETATALPLEESSTQSQSPDSEAIQAVQTQPNDPESTTEQSSTSTEPSSQARTSESETTYLETVAEVAELDETELQLLVDCCKHVAINPRTAKRLINIYKILQIVWETRSQKKENPQPIPTDPAKRVVISLLALSGRYPNYMRNVFDEISLQLEEAMLNAPPDSDTENNPKLNLELNQLLQDANPQPHQRDRHTQREWRRFTGDITRMIQDPESLQTPLKHLTIDRRTFDLMRSFCFVGDVGYDPTDFNPTERARNTTEPSAMPSAMPPETFP